MECIATNVQKGNPCRQIASEMGGVVFWGRVFYNFIDVRLVRTRPFLHNPQRQSRTIRPSHQDFLLPSWQEETQGQVQKTSEDDDEYRLFTSGIDAGGGVTKGNEIKGPGRGKKRPLRDCGLVQFGIRSQGAKQQRDGTVEGNRVWSWERKRPRWWLQMPMAGHWNRLGYVWLTHVILRISFRSSPSSFLSSI